MDNINSVQFSNHTGYTSGFKGQVLNEKELAELFAGLVANDLHNQYTHLLTGYVGNPTFLREIANILKILRSINPSLIYGEFNRKIGSSNNVPIYVPIMFDIVRF